MDSMIIDKILILFLDISLQEYCFLAEVFSGGLTFGTVQEASLCGYGQLRDFSNDSFSEGERGG